LSPKIGKGDGGEAGGDGVGVAVLDRPSRQDLAAALESAGGNVSALARRLGKHRNQVIRWLDYYGIGRDGAG
jgi:transcriptional regulator of acetoin/glycerol metabolism